MAFFKVRDGVSIGHNGKDVHGGDVIELPEHFKAELSGRADLCDAEGNVIDLATDQPALATSAGFETRPAHERVSLLEQERDRLQAALDSIETAIERAQADAEKPREPAPEVDSGVTRSYSETKPRQPVVSGTGNVAPANDPNRGNTTANTAPGPDFKSQ